MQTRFGNKSMKINAINSVIESGEKLTIGDIAERLNRELDITLNIKNLGMFIHWNMKHSHFRMSRSLKGNVVELEVL